jgi:hypothetical protein
MLKGEAANTNFMFFGLTLPGLEPMIYHILKLASLPLRHQYDLVDTSTKITKKFLGLYKPVLQALVSSSLNFFELVAYFIQ